MVYSALRCLLAHVMSCFRLIISYLVPPQVPQYPLAVSSSAESTTHHYSPQTAHCRTDRTTQHHSASHVPATPTQAFPCPILRPTSIDSSHSKAISQNAPTNGPFQPHTGSSRPPNNIIDRLSEIRHVVRVQTGHADPTILGHVYVVFLSEFGNLGFGEAGEAAGCGQYVLQLRWDEGR